MNRLQICACKIVMLRVRDQKKKRKPVAWEMEGVLAECVVVLMWIGIDQMEDNNHDHDHHDDGWVWEEVSL